MAAEAGIRKWWRFHQNVNVANGNLFLVLGSNACPTCGETLIGGYRRIEKWQD